MLIEFLQWFGGPAADFRRGDTADLPAAIARNLVACGIARPYRAAPVETATVAAPETTAAGGKPARRRGKLAATLRSLI